MQKQLQLYYNKIKSIASVLPHWYNEGKGGVHMKKNNTLMSVVSALIMCFGFSITAFANSSWVWITNSRPYDVLPFVIVFTLVAETCVIAHFSKIESKSKVFVPVLIGNLISYAMPYINESQTMYGEYYGLKHSLDHGPSYTVGTAFLIMTLVAEFPVVYFSLKKKTENKRALAISIIAVNVLTTAAVALTERLICRGHW